MDKADTGDEGLDDVDFLQGGDDEQLQAVLGRLVGAKDKDGIMLLKTGFSIIVR